MIKTIIKETFIIALLCAAILLVLSVLFYDYNPVVKVAPSTIQYSTPDDVKTKIDGADINTSMPDNPKRVYTIDGSDLTIYQKSQTYDPSKENPFVSIDTNTVSTDTGSTTKVNTDGSSSNKSSNTSSSTSSSSTSSSTSSSATSNTEKTSTTKSTKAK